MTTHAIPSYVRAFALTKVTTGGVTYHLRPAADDHRGEWALATVNDETGELVILSDWGNWAFRWNTLHLGRPSLTHFIADRDPGHCEYLADKLSTREEREVFDVDETVLHMKRALLAARLAWGRELIGYYCDEDPEDRVDVGDPDPPRMWHRQRVWDRYRHEHEAWPLTKRTARALFEALAELRSDENVERFVDAFFKIEGHEFICEEPWNGALQYRPACRYMQLLHGILPALVRACRERVAPEARSAV
jgi:hypothetical protein